MKGFVLSLLTCLVLSFPVFSQAIPVTGSLAKNFSILDYDGPGIGTLRNCNMANIDCHSDRDCVQTRNCTPTMNCSPTRNCEFSKSHDTRNCNSCLLRAPRICILGGCSGGQCVQRGNDPICEAAKASQNAAYEAAYSGRKADCERLKTQDKIGCEAKKSNIKADCERLKEQKKQQCKIEKASEKLLCEVDKKAKGVDCERVKSQQMLAGEFWEAAIQEARSQALSENPRPIPPFIRAALEPYFTASLLNSVQWTDDHGNIISISKLATETGGRSAITLGNIIVFKSEETAKYDIGLWAHELEHVKQYQLLGIDHFAEYYADYWIATEVPFVDGRFHAAGNPGPRDIQAYVTRMVNKLEALAGVQSVYVCDLIDPTASFANKDIFNSNSVVIAEDANACRPSYY